MSVHEEGLSLPQLHPSPQEFPMALEAPPQGIMGQIWHTFYILFYFHIYKFRKGFLRVGL